MEKKLLTQEQIKDELFNMLVEFDELCARHNIKYSLCGGTLLGAIRHKDFIPWDDDVDVFMSRTEYNRLLKIKTDINEEGPYTLVDMNDDTAPVPFLKYINKNIMVNQLYINKKYKSYLWIDIFPIDGLPESRKKQKRLLSKVKLERFMLESALRGANNTIYDRLTEYIRIMLHPLTSMIGAVNWARIIEKDSSAFPYETSREAAGIVWGYGMCEILPKEDFEGHIKVRFRDREFSAMSGWDKYLSHLYGNYMELPPENQRTSHELKAWKVK